MKTPKRNSHKTTEAQLRVAFEKIKVEGRPTGPSAFAREVGIDRTYLYAFPSLVAEIADYGRKTQPGISKRGAGAARSLRQTNDQLTAQIRQEHKVWSIEISVLRSQAKKAEERVSELEKLNLDLERKLNCLQSVYEAVLYLAVESGANPIELERLQSSLSNGCD